MVTPLSIIAAAVTCYTAVETGIYMFKHREAELPQRKDSDPAITMHGSYFSYLFRDSCEKCDKEDNYSSDSYRIHLLQPDQYEVRHDCKGHTVYDPESFDYDQTPEKFDVVKVEGGSKYSTRGFAVKLSDFAQLAFKDFRETFFKPKEEDSGTGINRVFSTDSVGQFSEDESFG